ncbi:MAG: PilC/PilY family type IV pilus protein, partial [Myxococcales bacterium]
MKPIARYAARIIALWGLSIALLPIAGASAQNPDLREIVPYMMLVVDTSGSMERLPGCVCETPGCVECLPDCSLDNVSGVPPVDADGNELKKNRWAVTLEALTGTIDDFECEALQRTIDNGMSYDLGYYLPYHQPWDCTGGGVCAIDSADSLFSQQTNGIIDEFSARVQFGLMTYDGMDTYVGAPPLVPEVDFNHNLSESEQGLWSYGGAKSFHYPNCVTDYMMDTGARSADAEQGGLVAIDSCTATNCAPWCDFCPAQPSQSVINREIEQALLSARPYGGTPIAASLDDLYYHFKEDLVDTLASCRNRYALLITDGYPDDDYRSFGCDCADAPDPDAACGGPPNDPATMHCPYPTPEQAAFDLVNGKSGDPAMIERLFVVGLAIDDQTVIDRLNAIADNGCPDTTCTALEADDLTTLVSSLSAVINDIIEPISRSVPSFASSSGTQATAKQYQISTGFKLPIKQGDPWTGIIERRRFVCDSGDVVPVPLSSAASDGDRFHIVLNSGIPANRKLWSVDWDVSQDPGSGHLYSVDSETTACSGSYCDTVRPLTDSFFSPERLGLAAGDTGGRDEVLAWMYGDVGTPRADKRLGDVYHSSPLVVGAPRFDTSDEAFNLFRGSTVVATRPLTLYVGSNDGILHAFSVEDFQQGTNSFQAGEELWGFVPPVMIDRMKESIDGSHHFSMDGSPVTKNVYFSRIKGLEATENEYHTVLITGMRNGGNAYVALDVTDPLNPEFLWQFTHEGMGLTYAKPAIGQAVFTVGAAGETKNGAVAILPGGKGTLGISGEPNDCTNGLSNPSMRKTGSG